MHRRRGTCDETLPSILILIVHQLPNKTRLDRFIAKIIDIASKNELAYPFSTSLTDFFNFEIRSRATFSTFSKIFFVFVRSGTSSGPR